VPELQRLSVTVEVLRVGVMIVGVISVGVLSVGVMTLSRFSDTAAHYVYPLLESIQEGTIHQWLWKAALYPYTVLCIRRRNACRLKF
jgi:hypothetical protein